VVVIVLGALRSLALLRRTSGATWREAFGAFGLWTALGWTVAKAAARGLVAREGVFLTTPKVRGELGPRHALRGNLTETVIGLSCAVIGVVAVSRGNLGAVAVGVLLVIQAVGYLAAPLNSMAAIRSDLPEELRRRRREMLPSWGTPARRGGLVLAFGLAAAVGLIAFATPLDGPELGRIDEQARQQSESGGPNQPRGSDTTGTSEPGSTGATSGAPTGLSGGTSSPTTLSATTAPTGPGEPTQAGTHATSPTQATQATQPTSPTQATNPTLPTQATHSAGAATHPTSHATGGPPTSTPSGGP
jgi:hypothetical protein